jgi:hypothetical protein
VWPGAPSGSAAPEDQRVVEQAARLQIGQQRGDRLIDFLGVLRVVGFQFAVLVSLVEVRASDEPHAPLGEAAIG